MSTPRPDPNERHLARGSTADMAVEGGKVKPEDKTIHEADAPHARRAKPLVEGEKHDQLAKKEQVSENRQEALLDEAIEESFPSSDPPSAKRIT